MFKKNPHVSHSRKIVAKLILLLSIIAGGSLSAQTVTEKIGVLFYELDSQKREAIVVADTENSYSGLSNISIPSNIEFDGNTYTVTAIGDNVFAQCTALKEVTLADGDEPLEFGESVFDKAPLERLYLGRNFTCKSIDWSEQPFSNKANLTDVQIGDKVTAIADYTLYNCVGIPAITLPESVKSIGSNAFANCKKMESINIPASVTSIGDRAFFNCYELRDVGSLGEISEINDATFFACYALASIAIPNTVKTIGQQAFYGCINVTSFDFPESVVSIGSQAFYYCKSLISFSLPNSVVSVGDNVFAQCTALKEVTLADGDEPLEFGESVFDKAPLESLYLGRNFTCSNSYESAFQPFSGKEKLSDVQIGDKVTAIADYTFYNCDGLSQITLPESLKSIGNLAFSDCISLNSIELPKSVESLGVAVFSSCANLEEVKILGSLSEIPSATFAGCWELKSINIPESVKSIGSHAFENCSKLTSIEIPESVTTIGEQAFIDCKSLNSIELPKSVESLGVAVFSSCANLEEVKILGSLSEIPSATFAGCWELKSINIPESVKSIGSHAFENCSKLTSIEIPESITSIEEDVFYHCSALEEIKIPKNVTSIGRRAFYFCSKLTSIEIPESVTTIGEQAFIDCKSLEFVKLPTALESIGLHAFSGCMGVKEVYYMSPQPIQEDCYGDIWDAVSDVYAIATLHVHPKAKAKISDDSISPWCNFIKRVTVAYADFDLDGHVHIDDAIKVANFAIGNEIEGDFMEELADVNEDDIVTISDAVGAVAIVLSQPAETAALQMPAESNSDITDYLVLHNPVDCGSNNYDISISLDNSASYVALQADIFMPEGMRLESVAAGVRALNHTVMYKKINENVYRIVVYNFNGDNFDECEGLLLTLHTAAGGNIAEDIIITNVVASDVKGRAYHLGVYRSGTTGIDSIVTGNDSAIGVPSVSVESGRIQVNDADGERLAVYSADGRLVATGMVENGSADISLASGVYVVVVENMSAKIVVR